MYLIVAQFCMVDMIFSQVERLQALPARLVFGTCSLFLVVCY